MTLADLAESSITYLLYGQTLLFDFYFHSSNREDMKASYSSQVGRFLRFEHRRSSQIEYSAFFFAGIGASLVCTPLSTWTRDAGANRRQLVPLYHYHFTSHQSELTLKYLTINLFFRLRVRSIYRKKFRLQRWLKFVSLLFCSWEIAKIPAAFFPSGYLITFCWFSLAVS